MDFTYFADSRIGGRETNEDCWLFYPLPFLHTISVFVVADGMGGLSHGAACARRTAAAFCSELLYALYPDALRDPDIVFSAEQLEQAARTAALAAAERVYQEGCDQFSSSGSTLTAAVLGQDALVVVSLGDSPAYLVQDSQTILLNPLHNLAFEQRLHPGMPGYEEAACCLTQCVGTRPASCLDPEVCSRPLASLRGSLLLLGSDGAFGTLPAGRIRILANALRATPSEIIPVLFAAARESGSTDNQTLIAICL